jgi:branched-chain amino acid transport system substrate-binding protein
MNLPRFMFVATATGLVALLAACGAGGNGSGSSQKDLVIALNVPTSADPFLAGELVHGAQLAVKEQNAKGLTLGGTGYRLVVKTYDDNGQPQQAASNVQSAIHDGAVAVLEDGIGAKTSGPATSAAGVPEIVFANGDVNLLDPQSKPSLFRLGIPNDADATVLGKYIAGKANSVAIIHDDSESGRDAGDQLASALATATITAQPIIEVAAGTPTIDTQIQQLTAAKPAAIAIEGGDTFIGHVVSGLRGAGVTTPVYTGPFGEFPAVRSIAGAAADGLAFAPSRLTSENNETSFPAFEKRLAQSGYGCTDAGLKNSGGQEILQPDDYAMYAYDATNVVAAALKKANSATPSATLLRDMTVVSVKSANGDNRGFNSQTREGILDDDIYIAAIHDNQFQPVKDEALSASLPTIDQILADCPK